MSAEKIRLGEVYHILEQMSEDDKNACLIDIGAYGRFCCRVKEDGSYERIPPENWIDV